MNFPLQLTTFEQFLLWEDRPAYPWNFFGRFDFEGNLHREAFQDAVASVLQRHPILMSRVERRGHRWMWVLQPDARVPIEWLSEPATGGYPAAEYLDLEKVIGVRLYVRPAIDGDELMFQFHHACCDGAGALRFVNEILIDYALRRGASSDRVELPESDPERLLGRGKYGLTPWKLVKKIPRQMIGLAGALQFMQRKPAPILPHTVRPNDESAPPSYPSVLVHFFNPQQTKAYYAAAKKRGASWNDLLARDLFLAINRWRERLGLDRSEWMRMMIPMNLRVAADRKLPAANVVSSVFLDRRGSDFDDEQRLLDGLRHEMKIIKENQLGLTFVFSLWLLRLIPGGLKRAARKNECTLSCIFSNPGRNIMRSPLPKKNGCLVAGDVRLLRVSGIAPLRPYAATSFASMIYGGQLSLSLHYDPRPITKASATELLQAWQDQIQQTLELN